MTSVTVTDRPLVTFFLFGYKQERFAPEAIEGAFRQTYQPLEIILSDDCSPDRTFEIMREMAASYGGPHQVRINRNGSNLGIGGHVNRGMELARGELFVVGAADDVSLPHRTEAIVAAWLKSHRRACSIYSAFTIIDETGRQYGRHDVPLPPANWDLLKLCREFRMGVAGVSHAWHRSIFDRFGPLNRDIVYEDQVLPLRSRLLGEVVHLPEQLVLYRRAEGCITMPKQEGPLALELRQWNRLHAERVLAVYRQWAADLSKADSPPAGHTQVMEALFARAHFDSAMQEKGFFKRLRACCAALRHRSNVRYVLRTYPLFASWHGYNLWNRLIWKGNFWQMRLNQTDSWGTP